MLIDLLDSKKLTGESERVLSAIN